MLSLCRRYFGFFVYLLFAWRVRKFFTYKWSLQLNHICTNNPSGVVWMTQDLKLGCYVVIVKGKDDDQIIEEVDKSENERFPVLRSWNLITNWFHVVSSFFMLWVRWLHLVSSFLASQLHVLKLWVLLIDSLGCRHSMPNSNTFVRRRQLSADR